MDVTIASLAAMAIPTHQVDLVIMVEVEVEDIQELMTGGTKTLLRDMNM